MEIRGLKEKLAQIGTPAAGIVSSLAIKHAMTVENAWMRLLAIMPPQAKDDVLAEVDHRRELMGELRAIESVHDDVATGRWPL